MQLNQAESWSYVFVHDDTQLQDLSILPADMEIVGGPALTPGQIAAVEQGGPNGSRLVIAYMDAAEVGTYDPEWRASYANGDGRPDGGAPDWLANANPAYTGIYTAKYWLPSWEAIVFHQIDQDAAAGYSGVFLDAVSSWLAFAPGNAYGNAVRPTAQADMAKLLDDIRSYVDLHHPGFLILANDAQPMFGAFPSVVKDLDGLVAEGTYWEQSSTDGLAFGPGPGAYFDSNYAQTAPFRAAGKPIFSVDYIPQPGMAGYDGSADANSDLAYFEKTISAGYVGAITHPDQTVANALLFPHFAYGGSGADTLTGAADFQNYLSGGGGGDLLEAGPKNDVLFGGAGDDTLIGGVGNDDLQGGDGADSIDGGDAVRGNTGDDTISGGAGNDAIRGLDGNDSITGDGGDDNLNGNQGNDQLHGGDGNDTVFGGQGNDTLWGDGGVNLLNGNKGDDILYAGAQGDTLFGGQGNDTIHGGDGNDVISGDLGDDMLFGGKGADRFLFGPGGGADRIGDFNAAEGDRIVLPAGTAYTILTVQGEAVIDLGHGDSIVLSGVAPTQMGAWLLYA